MAVAGGELVGEPFFCTDYYGRSGLMFSPRGPGAKIRAKIATAFWSLLLDDPDELADFEARVYHSGAGIWLHFGCESGVPTCHESSDPDE